VNIKVTTLIDIYLVLYCI